MAQASPNLSPCLGLRSFAVGTLTPCPSPVALAVCQTREPGCVSVDAMRPFACATCRSVVFFENFRCVTCASQLGFDRAAADLVVLDGSAPRCANSGIADCNWLADPASAGGLCGSCALTRTRPNDSDTAAMAAFAATEAAKRRLVVQLDHLGLPTTSDLRFDLLSSR